MAEHRVRSFELEDWRDVAELFLARECCWGTLQIPYQSRDDVRKKLENPPPRFHRLVALSADTERVVGLLSLRCMEGRRAHVGDIGMLVHPEFHRQGAGSALMSSAIELAERWLALTRIELTVFVDNVAAIKLYEKFGFGVEGTLRRYAFRDGEYVDVYAMARLSSA